MASTSYETGYQKYFGDRMANVPHEAAGQEEAMRRIYDEWASDFDKVREARTSRTILKTNIITVKPHPLDKEKCPLIPLLIEVSPNYVITTLKSYGWKTKIIWVIIYRFGTAARNSNHEEKLNDKNCCLPNFDFSYSQTANNLLAPIVNVQNHYSRELRTPKGHAKHWQKCPFYPGVRIVRAFSE